MRLGCPNEEQGSPEGEEAQVPEEDRPGEDRPQHGVAVLTSHGTWPKQPQRGRSPWTWTEPVRAHALGEGAKAQGSAG